MASKKPKRGAKTRTANTAAEWRPSFEVEEKRFADGAKQERLAWLDRPQLHTTEFEWFWKDEKAERKGAELIGVSKQRKREVEEIRKHLGWSKKRLISFTQLVVAYRSNPSIDNYLRVKHEFPEVEIQVDHFFGIDPLFELEDDFKKQGIEPKLIAAALDSYEPYIDALSLRLLELLAAREKLPKDGPGHIQKRRDAISDATVNYLIATMLESYDWHGERFRIPASLVVLIRHQLCGGGRSDLHTTYLSRKRRTHMEMRVAKYLKPGEKLSVNKLVQLTGLKRATAARWLKQGFSTEVAQWQTIFKTHGPARWQFAHR